MTDITVTVDDAHLRSIATVARELAARGMTVDRVLPAAGCIMGSVPARSGAAALRSVPGVVAVDPQIVLSVPVPDADVQ
ncbi:hypothetical protein [Nakamurella sp.]|uniref:hypothetical protein n=1 Tax=Nakamurella sp. TaxID=1869182 RepID=UPI003B3B2347